MYVVGPGFAGLLLLVDTSLYREGVSYRQTEELLTGDPGYDYRRRNGAEPLSDTRSLQTRPSSPLDDVESRSASGIAVNPSMCKEIGNVACIMRHVAGIRIMQKKFKIYF